MILITLDTHVTFPNCESAKLYMYVSFKVTPILIDPEITWLDSIIDIFSGSSGINPKSGMPK